MKIEFEPKFKIGQKVYLIEFAEWGFRDYYKSEYRPEEYTITAYVYYNENDIRYNLEGIAYKEKDIYTDLSKAEAKAKELNNE